MPSPPLVVIHERIGAWHRQLRPRFLTVEPSLRWAETRSGDDLVAAVSGSTVPILVVDLKGRLRAGLDDLDRAMLAAPDALALVLDPEGHAGLPELAREIGASHVLSGPTRPPEVHALLLRWLPLATRLAESAGWSTPVEPEPEPWEQPDRFAAHWLTLARWARR